MITRRNLLRTAAAAAVATPAAAVLAAQAGGATGGGKAAAMPLRIVNRTGAYDNASIHVYIVGNDGTRQVRVTPEGELAPVSLSDNGADGYTDYAIPLSASGETTLTLPRMSGRIYTALGGKLRMKAVEDGDGKPALAYPAGWVESDPNFEVLHDAAEFTYNESGMYCNTTMVDMFSVPLSLRLQGQKDQEAGTLKDGARDQVFETLRGTEGFDRLVIGDRRVLAPSHGIGAGRFAGDYFDPYVDQVWETYQGKDLTVSTDAGRFTGRVRGGKLAFTGPGELSFDRPSTSDVLFCHGALQAPNDGVQGPVAAVLGAALNRTTLAAHADQPTDDPSGFYGGKITHHYAKALHAATTDGKAYGFAFDDVGGFASYIEDGAPSSVTLTLTPF
ncbi:beta-1,3-glucanase family protein [Streptomyces boncukensis]|uniref:Glycosyl hydrolase n=1 Tax=Streptomyces boncukensis TaxID=2711219 RepID=A0A6G4WY57_9ACTN|nr:beta-1,3-glucanase family protein [Streptomyces boncukensis]NGO70229.1 glycosyl hydrolase [Streptomyces boncukensis]